MLRLQRPPEFATDRDWAEYEHEKAWDLQDRLHAAEGALDDIRRAVKGWDGFVASITGDAR